MGEHSSLRRCNMKILSAICLAVLLLPVSPFLILFFGGAELYKLYEEVLKNVCEYLDKQESD